MNSSNSETGYNVPTRAILEKDAIVKIIRKTLVHRKQIIRNTIIGCVIGIVFALGVNKTWTSTVVLAPEVEGGGLSSQLSSMASLVGIGGFENSTEALYPELYPQIIESKPFVTGLFSVPVTKLDGSLTTDLYSYLFEHQSRSWWDWPVYLFKRGLKMAVSMISSDNFKKSSDEVDPFYLSQDQEGIYNTINKNVIYTSVDKRTQVITIQVKTQDALISASLADTVQQRLQDAITEYRTKKARRDLMYAEQMKRDAWQTYTKAQTAHALFADAHASTHFKRVDIEQERLSNEADLALTQYSKSVEIYNNALSKLQERTPSFTILQPAAIEIKPSSTPKIVVMLLWVFLFFAGTVTWYACRDTLAEWYALVKGKASK